MGLLDRFLRKLGMFVRREEFNRELEEEMAFHRAEATKEFRVEGMASEDARHRANRQFGNDARLRDESRQTVAFWFESTLQDFRFALRQLRKNPGFALTAILILTFGIGASVAIFGFVDAALIKPLPYKDPTRLVQLFESTPLGPRFHLSYFDYLDWKKTQKSFSSLEVFAPYGFMMKTPDGIQPVDGASVSAGFFKALGVTPVLGRDSYPGEDAQSAARVALLSYGAWQKRYGGRKDVLGQAVILNGNTVSIIGVLPQGFHFVPAEPADFWASEHGGGSGCEGNRGCHNLYGVARLKDGVSFASAFADIKTIAQQLERQYPDTNREQVAFMLPLVDVIVGEIRPILLLLLGGATLLLLIAAVNVASLLLVRSEGRRREIAVRGALGASSGRLLRQFVTEGLLLSTAGGVLGVAAGITMMRLLTLLVPKDILATMPYLQGLGWNTRVAAFAVAICAVTSVLFAFTPMFRLSLTEIRDGLTEGGRSAAGTLWRRFGVNLVVVEIAIAMVLLVGAGLLGQSLFRLLHADAGLEADHMATLQVAAMGDKYKNDPPVVGLEREIRRQVAGLPGVKSVGFTSQLPLGDGDGTRSFHRLDLPFLNVNQEVAVRYVSSDYFPTLEARILRGRNFREDEDASKPPVVIVNQTLAQKYFRDTDPVGKQIAWDGDSKKTPVQIVAVVNDLQEGQLDAAPRGAIYVPFDQDSPHYFALVVRTSQTEEALLASLTETIRRIDPQLAVFRPSTMAQRLHDSPSAYLHRTSAWMVGGFAAIALVLSVVGLYGVTAYSVSQRTREIGVRMALGAQRGSVYRLILGEAGWLTVAGIAAGLVTSLAVTTLMRKLLFGVKAWDVPTLIAVAVVLGACALLASYLPAKRAASVNPVEALRSE